MFNIELFPKRLRESRMYRGLSQKELAEMAEITPSSLSSYEKDSNAKGSKTPTLSTAVKIAEQLGVSIDWLCGQDEVKKDIISSYGDVFDLFIEISKRMDYEIGFKTVGEGQTVCPTITLLDDEMSYLFSQWKKVKTLFDSGTIDIDIYEQWIKKWKGTYDIMPLEVLKKFRKISLEDFEALLEKEEEKKEEDQE